MLLNFNNYSAYIGMSYYSNRLHGKLGGFSSLSNIKRKGLIRIWLSLQLCNISLKNCPHKILDEFLKFYPITDNFTPLQCLCQSAEFKHCLSHRRHLTFLQGSTENAHVLSYFSYNEIFCSCCCCIGAQQGYFTLFPRLVARQCHWLQQCQRPKGNQEPPARSAGSYTQDFPWTLTFFHFFGWKKNWGRCAIISCYSLSPLCLEPSDQADSCHPFREIAQTN